MRLNKTDKEAFVRAVMDDVPEIDYEAQGQAAFEKWLVSVLPPKLAAVYADPTLKHALDQNWIGPAVPLIHGYQICGSYAVSLPKALTDELSRLEELLSEQNRARSALEEKITAAINACATLKVAKARLPEFEKYLPADRDGNDTKNLPVIANLVADLVTAGWPKTQGA